MNPDHPERKVYASTGKVDKIMVTQPEEKSRQVGGGSACLGKGESRTSTRLKISIKKRYAWSKKGRGPAVIKKRRALHDGGKVHSCSTRNRHLLRVYLLRQDDSMAH